MVKNHWSERVLGPTAFHPELAEGAENWFSQFPLRGLGVLCENYLDKVEALSQGS